MTYQQIWDGMTKKEKVANRITCLFKVDDKGSWVRNSVWNKILYRVAKLVLGGVDPLDRIGFYGSLLDDNLRGCTLPELMADLYNVKVAWAKF